jgi:hypothetical protein
MTDLLSEDQILEFKEAFDMISKDQEGYITAKELGVLFRLLAEKKKGVISIKCYIINYSIYNTSLRETIKIKNY